MAVVPCSAAILSMATESSKVAAPSSIPNSTWLWISIKPQVYRTLFREQDALELLEQRRAFLSGEGRQQRFGGLPAGPHDEAVDALAAGAEAHLHDAAVLFRAAPLHQTF